MFKEHLLVTGPMNSENPLTSFLPVPYNPI